MSYLDPSDTPQTRVGPALMMGAASPLWGYFGAAAASGLAFWWMTRWTRPMNLEAFFANAADAAEPILEPFLEAVEVAAEVVADEPATLVAAALELEHQAEAAPERAERVTPEPLDVVAAEPPVVEPQVLKPMNEAVADAPLADLEPVAPADVTLAGPEIPEAPSELASVTKARTRKAPVIKAGPEA